MQRVPCSKLIKHIPKSARSACCRRLSKLLNEITANTDDKSTLMALLNFRANYLLPPSVKVSGTTVIKKRMEKGAEHDDVNSTSPKLMTRRKLDDDGLLADRGWEHWNICQDPRIKWQACCRYIRDARQSPGQTSSPSTQMTSSELFDPFQLDRGPDGLRPPHYLELATCREAGRSLSRRSQHSLMFYSKEGAMPMSATSCSADYSSRCRRSPVASGL